MASFVLQIRWYASGPHYWEYTWRERSQRTNGSCNEWISRLLRRISQTPWSLCLGRDMGKGKNHVSINWGTSKTSHRTLNMRDECFMSQKKDGFLSIIQIGWPLSLLLLDISFVSHIHSLCGLLFTMTAYLLSFCVCVFYTM